MVNNLLYINYDRYDQLLYRQGANEFFYTIRMWRPLNFLCNDSIFNLQWLRSSNNIFQVFYVYYWNNYQDKSIPNIKYFENWAVLQKFVGHIKPQFMPMENLFKRLYCFVITTHCSIFSAVECTHWYIYVTELQSFDFLMWQFYKLSPKRK